MTGVQTVCSSDLLGTNGGVNLLCGCVRKDQVAGREVFLNYRTALVLGQRERWEVALPHLECFQAEVGRGLAPPQSTAGTWEQLRAGPVLSETPMGERFKSTRWFINIA